MAMSKPTLLHGWIPRGSCEPCPEVGLKTVTLSRYYMLCFTVLQNACTETHHSTPYMSHWSVNRAHCLCRALTLSLHRWTRNPPLPSPETHLRAFAQHPSPPRGHTHHRCSIRPAGSSRPASDLRPHPRDHLPWAHWRTLSDERPLGSPTATR